MRPSIDISRIEKDQAFIKLDNTFGVADRIGLYNRANNDNDALQIIGALVNVLDRPNNREEIKNLGLVDVAGGVLAALQYARQTIQGNQPTIPFNNQSTASHLVLLPA